MSPNASVGEMEGSLLKLQVIDLWPSLKEVRRYRASQGFVFLHHRQLAYSQKPDSADRTGIPALMRKRRLWAVSTAHFSFGMLFVGMA
jgi:hypothetical protein